MRNALVLLSATYIMSQFYRAFLAVLASDLQTDLGATEAQLSAASGAWFLVFALMQLPIGWALDRIGPRLTTSVLFTIGAGGGSLVFAIAQTPAHISVAMGLIGIGCAPILMASFFLIARGYSAAMFATLAAIVIAVGNLGNIGASLPMTMLVESVGWRMSMVYLGVVSAMLGALIWVIVRDPPVLPASANGSVLDLLRIPALWLIFPLIFVNYAPAAAIRGLWIGPYLDQVFGATATQIGWITLLMGGAMVIGSFAYGPLDRIFGTRKWVIAAGSILGLACCILLATIGDTGIWTATILTALVGITGTAFPVVVAHAKSFVPPHLTGRGVTLINMFGIGGVGILQVASGRVYDAVDQAKDPVIGFQFVFLFFAAMLTFGLVIYLFSQDRLD